VIFLLLAIASSALIAILMRWSQQKVSGSIAMLAMNYVACCALAALYAGPLVPKHEALGQTLALGGVNGFFYLFSFVLLQINVERNGVVLPAVFMKLGLLVPIALSIAVFGEVPKAAQIVGFVLAVAAILLINSQKNESLVRFKTGLILLLAAGGAGDAMSKVFEQVGTAELSGQFLFYTFAAALVLCVGLMLVKKQRIGKNEALFGLLVGVPNFFSARFLLYALMDLPAVLVYPTFSVGTILVVTLAGAVIFKEKLKSRQWWGLGAILAALVLLNI